MSDTQKPELPLRSLNWDDLASILYAINDSVAVHNVSFDQFGAVHDARLVWWNEAYKKVRTVPVLKGQSILETYFEPHLALLHIDRAWKEGHSFQLFEIPSNARDRYRSTNDRLTSLVNWTRLGGLVVETSLDITDFLAMQELLHDQKSLLAIASRKRALAVERERIARNLHDSVIQQLYATSLSLSMASYDADEKTNKAICAAVDSIAKVIEGIRREILDVETMKSSPLELQIEDSIIPILTPVNGEFDFGGNAPHVNDEFIPHIRAVCTEATSNAVRHGMATRVAISLDRDGDHLVLTITDNGLGIDPNAELHNGLKNMRERAQSMGGTMEVSSAKKGGTTIRWSAPHPGWES